MRASIIGARLVTALLTVWCPTCAESELGLESRREPRTQVAMQCPPGEDPSQQPQDRPDSNPGDGPREIPGSTSDCQGPCLACCGFVLPSVCTGGMVVTTPTPTPGTVLGTLSSGYPELLVPPPIRRSSL